MSLQEMIKQAKGRAMQAKGKVMKGQIMKGQLLSGKMLGGIYGKKILGGGSLGSGKMMNAARSTTDRVTRQLMERKPGIIPMVKEFKPGGRISKVFRGETVNLRSGIDAAVDGTAARISGGKRYRPTSRRSSSRVRDVSIAQ